jgi:hypothetical protein
MYSSGKSGEILREEVKFAKFVERLQNRFKYIILNPFITLLRLRGIDERYINEDFYNINFTKSNLFKEYREIELTEAKLSILGSVAQQIYNKNTNPQGMFSEEYIQKYFLMMTDEQRQENEQLKKKEEMRAPEAIGGGEMGGGGFGGIGGGGIGGGGEFGGPAPAMAPETPAAAPAGAPGAAEAPGAIPVPPAESVIPNGKNMILEHWNREDINIRKKYKR